MENSNFVIVAAMFAAFMVAYLFPKLKDELAPSSYPTDSQMAKSFGGGVALGVLSVLISILGVHLLGTSGDASPSRVLDLSYSQIIVVVLASPILEEFLIRGILTESLAWTSRQVKPWREHADVIAEVVAAIVFVSLHIPSSTNVVVTVITVGLLSALLGELRRRLGIISSILAHVGYNVVVAFSAIILTAL